MELQRLVDLGREPSHKQTVWIKATVRTIRPAMGQVILNHPSLSEEGSYGLALDRVDGFACDIDDLYVLTQPPTQE